MILLEEGDTTGSNGETTEAVCDQTSGYGSAEGRRKNQSHQAAPRNFR